MPTILVRALLLAGLLGLVFLGVTLGVGVLEALVTVAGIVLIGATAWYSPDLVRIVGAVWLGLTIFVFVRLPLGEEWGAAIALVAAGLAWWLLPVRVQRRVAFTVPLLVFLIFVVTLLMYQAPGSPFDSEKARSLQVQEAQKAKWAVADTPLEYFGLYMGRLIREGSLGDSYRVQGRSVLELLLPALPVSMSLGMLALVFAVAIGLLMGILAGLRPNSGADHASMALAMVGISLPNFVIGALFLIVFALWLGWLPVAGWGGYEHLFLPALTLSLPYAAYIARLARGGTIEIMQQDFVRTARAKGLAERAVVLKHAFKGAILPVVSFLGPAAAGIFTGSFVIEFLFNIPGMGRWFVNSATGRDYGVVLGTAVIYFTLITFFNLLVDFAYAWLDPRVREEL